MVVALNNAVSGINAASQRISVSASNIANAFSTQTIQTNGAVTNTPYIPQVLDQASQAGGGVLTHTQDANPPTVSVYDPTNPAAGTNGITQYPNVDQARELVNLKIGTYDAQGNLAVIKAEDKMLKSVLDIIS